MYIKAKNECLDCIGLCSVLRPLKKNECNGSKSGNHLVYFQRLSMTQARFHDFLSPENQYFSFHDCPDPVCEKLSTGNSIVNGAKQQFKTTIIKITSHAYDNIYFFYTKINADQFIHTDLHELCYQFSILHEMQHQNAITQKVVKMTTQLL